MVPLTPTSLEGQYVRLVPLTVDQAESLFATVEPALQRWTITPALTTVADMAAYIAQVLAEQTAGATLPFAITWASTGEIVGSTRLANYSPAHRWIEIGWTWLAPAWRRTAVNTEAKLLLLQHAFEVLGCRRVEFRVDALNTQSRAAVRRLGATEEGVLRGRLITETGRVCDIVYYSLLDTEWPTVRTKIRGKLDRSSSNTATVRVRVAGSGDVEAITRLGQAAHAHHAVALPEVFQEPGPQVWTASDVRAVLENPLHLVLVAELDGRPVGYAHGEVQELPATAVKRPSRVFYLRQMGVDHAHRRQGVGHALLATIQSQLPDFGLDRMTLDVYAFNTEARRLYVSEGFTPVREHLQKLLDRH